MRPHALACALAGLLGSASHAGAQQPDVIVQGEHLVVSVLTFGQGDQVWERFGHNALRLRDTLNGIDIAYNWGTFSFDQPRFLQRFLTGNTLYWLDTVPGDVMIGFYARELNRSVIEQRLELTPAQREKLRAFLAWNVREANRYYRYDYFLDNCSTRLRDAIDTALGGALRSTLVGGSPHTFRSESLRLMTGLPLTQAGMHVALGAPADRPMTAWEETFVPMRLRDRLRGVRIPGASGLARPLVAEERVLYTARRPAEATHGPSLVGRFAIVGLLLAGIVVWLGARARGGGRAARVGFAALGSIWGLAAGTLGIVLALAWGLTRHVFWYRNANLLPLAPIAVMLTVLVPLAAARPRWRRPALLVASTLVIATLVALGGNAIGAFPQRNLAVLLFALPVHAAIAWALRGMQTESATTHTR